MDKPTELELVDALLGMAVQYLTNNNGIVHCDYVSASEDYIDVLERLGLIIDGHIIECALNNVWLEKHLRGK